MENGCKLSNDILVTVKNKRKIFENQKIFQIKLIRNKLKATKRASLKPARKSQNQAKANIFVWGLLVE